MYEHLLIINRMPFMVYSAQNISDYTKDIRFIPMYMHHRIENMT